jgi:hypothetical protein
MICVGQISATRFHRRDYVYWACVLAGLARLGEGRLGSWVSGAVRRLARPLAGWDGPGRDWLAVPGLARSLALSLCCCWSLAVGGLTTLSNSCTVAPFSSFKARQSEPLSLDSTYLYHLD